VEAYAPVSAWAPEEAVDVLLRREDALRALAEAVWDEPAWVNVLTVLPIELEGRGVSVN
jgi:hypothetical protein